MLRSLLAVLLCLALSVSSAQDIVGAAHRFVQTLSTEQEANTVFPFDAGERYNFHFVPMTRKGITFNEMNAMQQALAIGLIKTCLSQTAFQKTQDIMQLEKVLKLIEKRADDDHYRDTGNYHITIFGIPAANTIWGWRLEGHHISFTFSVDKQKLVSGTPGFLGSNPAVVLEGPQKGKQVLKDETDLGFQLVQSLSSTQLSKALIDSVAPKDIVSFDKRNAMLENPGGITYADMTAIQQQYFLALVNLYVHRYTKLFAEDRLKEIQQAGLKNLHFSWAGAVKKEPGKGTYYRIQGPTLLVEYDNTQNNANHVHSVIRDLNHDFGGDELLEHYKTSH